MDLTIQVGCPRVIKGNRLFLLRCLHLFYLPRLMCNDHLLTLLFKQGFRFGSAAEKLDAAAIVAREFAADTGFLQFIHSFILLFAKP